MKREELVKLIRDLVGTRIELTHDYDARVTIGEARPVWEVTKKYVYMACKCHVKSVWEDDELVSVIRRIPVCGTIYGEITNKIKLDELCTPDLEKLYDGIIKYYEYQIERIPELQKQLDVCIKMRKVYNKVMGKKSR